MLAGSLVSVYKVVRQVFDVFFAFAERRNLHGNHVQTVIEVFAESFFGDFLLQFAVGGRDNANVDMLGHVRAERADFLVLQHAQEFDLGVQGHIANFVEKDGAAVGCFKKTYTFVLSTREGSTGVSEKFAFEQVFGNGTAVDGHELFVHAADGASDKFLTYAGFALNEHRACMHDGALDRFAELLHGRTFPDQVTHAFVKDLAGGMNFFELYDLRHQVEL